MKKTLLFLTISLFTITSNAKKTKETYFNNANLESVSQIDENGKTGDFKIYYANEQLRIVGNFDDGTKTWGWIFYHKNGQEQEMGKYENGKKLVNVNIMMQMGI
jgi:antitoxin component YwqK of YwqJK toxin-antitoxin module